MSNTTAMKISFDPKIILPWLRQAQPYLIGVALIGIFAYTSYVVNAAINVQPAPEETQTEVAPLPKITFDIKVIDSLKKLQTVDSTIPAGGLGRDDPFK